MKNCASITKGLHFLLIIVLIPAVVALQEGVTTVVVLTTPECPAGSSVYFFFVHLPNYPAPVRGAVLQRLEHAVLIVRRVDVLKPQSCHTLQVPNHFWEDPLCGDGGTLRSLVQREPKESKS